MTYVYEPLTPEDKARIGIDAIVRKHYSRKMPTSWWVDRETGNYSICIFWDRPDFDNRDNEKDYIFCWNGHVFDCFTIKWKQAREAGSPFYWWFFPDPKLPPELEPCRAEIHADFCNAMTACHSHPHLSIKTQFIPAMKDSK